MCPTVVMRTAALTAALCAVSALGGCGKGAPGGAPSEFAGKTEDEVLVIRALRILEAAENHTPENFEGRQRELLSLASPGFRQMGEEHLPARVKEVTDLGLTAAFYPDPDTVGVQKTDLGKYISARVLVEGRRSWTTRDGSAGEQRVKMGVRFRYAAADGPAAAPHEGWTLEVLR